MASSFKIKPSFTRHIHKLAEGIEEAALSGMQKVLNQAEKDAQQMKRWRNPGTYTHEGSDGSTWEWTVTGASAASITGYVVGHKKLKALNPNKATTITRTDQDGFTRQYQHTHQVDSGLTSDRSEKEGLIQGVVTMYTAYAPYLQKKEREGGIWGAPSAGLPVTIDVFAVNWSNYYAPRILKPEIARIMKRVTASFN